MKIIVDGMGGDKAPAEILKACAMAVKEFGIDIIITGKEETLKKVISDENISTESLTIINTEQVITMEDEPLSVVRDKKESSLAIGLKMLSNGEGNAFVSAGNSGALLAGGSMIVKRIKGIKRAAFAPVFPTKTGYVMLIDSGATIDCRPEFMHQYGIMGSAYMKNVYNIDKPRVGLANNGTEECKGTDLYIAAHKLLKEDKNINFIGNVEGRDIMTGKCDVIVADGFTGNLMLKTLEGMGLFFMHSLKDMFYANTMTKFAAALLTKQIKIFKKKADYRETGGAVLIGLQKPVIKAHGSSDCNAMFSAIRQAFNMSNTDIETTILNSISQDINEQKENNIAD